MKPSPSQSGAAGVHDAHANMLGASCSRHSHSQHQRRCQDGRPSMHWSRVISLDAVQANSTSTAQSKTETSTQDLSVQYTEQMQQQMGSPLVYRHQNGMNYTRIWEDVIVGSCVQTPQDVDRLVENEGVKTILCLQEDRDLKCFHIDSIAIRDHCLNRGDVNYIRCPIQDFDALSLQHRLPEVVATLHREHEHSGGTVYIHCTAGLGRAPAVAIAYMYWCRGWVLKDAVNHLTNLRYCGPKVFAIRQATVDVLYLDAEKEVQISVRAPQQSMQVQIAGLDFGWNSTVNLEFDQMTQRFSTQRRLRPGRFHFKCIVDGHWLCSTDYATENDGHHSNNYIEVTNDLDDCLTESAVKRLLSENGSMTHEERNRMLAALRSL